MLVSRPDEGVVEPSPPTEVAVEPAEPSGGLPVEAELWEGPPPDAGLADFCPGEVVVVVVGGSGASAPGKADRSGVVLEVEIPPVASPSSV